MLKYHKHNSKTYSSFIGDMCAYLDVFGIPPTFKIMKRAKFTTPIGLLFTFFICAVVIIYLVLQLQELLNQSIPTVITSDEQLRDSEPYKLEMRNFTFAMTLTNLNLQSLTTLNQHFTIDVYNCKRQRKIDPQTGKLSVEQNCTIYPTEPCSEKHFVTQQQKDYFSQIKLGYVQCIQEDIWKSNPPQLQGTSSGSIFQYLMVQIDQCRNTTALSTCAPKEEIEKQFRMGFYAVYMSDNLIKLDIPDQPYQQVIDVGSIGFSITSSRQIFETFRLAQLITDNGIIQQDNQYDNCLVHAQYRDTQELYNNLYVIQHYIILDIRSTVYKRSYIKLQTILSQIGGLWQIIFLVFTAILKPLINTNLNMKMANKLFQFESAQNQISKLKKKSNLTSTIKSSEIYDIENILKNRQTNFYAQGICYIFSLLFCCKKKEKIKLNYAREKFMNCLDVTYMVQKFLEIDKLKLILLDENQRALFECLPKPTIPDALFEPNSQQQILTLQNKKKYHQIMQDEQLDVQKIEQAYMAFVSLINQDFKSFVDEKLLDYQDEKVIALFQNLIDKNQKVNRVMSQIPFAVSNQLLSAKSKECLSRGNEDCINEELC